jgi:beta-lactamase class C
MKRPFSIFALLFLFLLNPLFSQISLSPAEQIVRKGIDEFMKEFHIPGVAVALYYDGKSYLFNFGLAKTNPNRPVTSNTIFEVASITKVFTTTALAVKVLQGRMRLQDPVANYLPTLHIQRAAINKVTLVELATHTSSLPRIPPTRFSGTKRQVMFFLRRWTPDYPIGTHYLYSNLGFGVLGFALANAGQSSYIDVIRETILRPLGMNSTDIIVPDSLRGNYAQGHNKKGEVVPHFALNAWPGGGALRSTSGDMLKFLEANLGLAGPQYLQNAMQVAQQPYYKVNDHLTMGLGWQRYSSANKPLIIDKNGGVPGFSSYIGMIPEKKIGIVILANKAKTHATANGRKILYELQALKYKDEQ